MRRLILPLLLLCLALSACYLRRFPVTPAVASQSVFQVLAAEGSGTAFAINHHYAITAGHVCYMEAAEHLDDLWLKYGRELIKARMVAWEVTPDVSGDLCILHTDADLGDGLILADVPPVLGTPDTIMGYPLGVYTVSHGKSVGPASTLAAHDHGDSGAPLFTDDGVYGVVVQEGAAQCPVSELKRFLDEMGVSYDITPHKVDEDPFPQVGGLG